MDILFIPMEQLPNKGVNMIKWIKSLFNKNKVMSASNPNLTIINQQNSNDLDEYEERLKHNYELAELKEKYKIKVSVDKKMFQYSKILTTFILIFTLALNLFYFCVLIPMSGRWGITDSAFEYPSKVLDTWNTGTIIFFMAYFAKALFESKFESDADIKRESLKVNVPNIIKDTVDKVVDSNKDDNAVG